jgi:GDP-D-mannose dehydratase
MLGTVIVGITGQDGTHIVGLLFYQPSITVQITGNSCINMIETIGLVNPKFYRPANVELLTGDPAKAKLS